MIELGPSDRYAAVIKSHVRRYLNEKHDVTNAEQFVEACLSHGGVKNVNVVECRFKPIHQSAQLKLNNIKKFTNFCFERHGIRVFRAWDIGEGLLLPYNKLINGVRYARFCFVLESKRKQFSHLLEVYKRLRYNIMIQNVKRLQCTFNFIIFVKSPKNFKEGHKISSGFCGLQRISEVIMALRYFKLSFTIEI